MPDFGSVTKLQSRLAICASTKRADKNVTSAARPQRAARKMRRGLTVMFCGTRWRSIDPVLFPNANSLVQLGPAVRTISCLAWSLRGCCRREGKFAALNEDEIPDVNQRV